MAESAVVGGEYEFEPLVGIGHIGELSGEFANESRCGGHIGLRIVDLLSRHPKFCGRARHELHQPACSRPRSGVGVETTLLITLRSDEFPIPARSGRGLFEERIVDRDDASVAREEDGLHVSAHLMHLSQAFLLFGLGFGQGGGAKPSAEGFGEFIGVGAHRPTRVLLVVVDSGGLQTGIGNAPVVNRQRSKVGFSAFHHIEQLGGVFRQLHPDLESLGVGEVVGQSVLQSHARSAIVVVGLGAGNGGHNEFSASAYVFEVRLPAGGCFLALEGSVHGRRLRSARLARTPHQRKQ